MVSCSPTHRSQPIQKIRLPSSTQAYKCSEILAVPGVNLSFPELYHAIEDLQFRVAYYIPIFTTADLQLMEQYVGDVSKWVHCEGAKVWVDGSSGSGESWSIAPSDIDDDHYGSQYFAEEELVQVVQHAETFGYSVKFHVTEMLQYEPL